MKRDKYLHDTNQLCCILDDLQKQLMGTRDQKNRDTLKGSYGVYLHHLKHKDPVNGRDYHNWMEWYNNKVMTHEKL